ncbi:hypothetical protein RJ55_06262 [Drechmeria coniospora]|nr:hypothetical protein RJ55_06262 [Drechmeria coniospora]
MALSTGHRQATDNLVPTGHRHTCARLHVLLLARPEPDLGYPFAKRRCPEHHRPNVAAVGHQGTGTAKTTNTTPLLAPPGPGLAVQPAPWTRRGARPRRYIPAAALRTLWAVLEWAYERHRFPLRGH